MKRSIILFCVVVSLVGVHQIAWGVSKTIENRLAQYRHIGDELKKREQAGKVHLYGDARVRKICSVYDGDTFTCNNSRRDPLVSKDADIRIRGIDTPESRLPRSMATSERARIKGLSHRAWWYSVCRLVGIREARRLCRLKKKEPPKDTPWKVRKARRIKLVDIQKPKYFRLLANVSLDGSDLGTELIEWGLAQPYDGGTKPKW